MESVTIPAGGTGTQGGSTPPAPAGTTIEGDGTKVTVQRTEGAQGGEDKSKLILGKFKDQAALEAAYLEAEKKIAEKPAPTPPAPTPPTPNPDLATAAIQAGFKLETLASEMQANGGKLTDATMQALAAKGITALMVETYVSGIRQQATADRAELLTVLNGNEADLKTLYEWAAVNLSKEELAGYNALVEGPTRNIPAAKLMLDSFVNRYNGAYGKEPATSVTGVTVPTATGPKPFGDRSEMVAAMADPRYSKSPAYRAEVEKRLSVTAF